MRQLFILLVMWVSVSANAQDVASFFIRMPDDQVPQLEEAWRKDLVDLFRSGKAATLKNLMEGRSTLKEMTADYLLLQISERSSLEIKLLPLINDTWLACVITTANAPVADSRVHFYSMQWKLLPSDDLWEPAMPEWFLKDSADANSQEFLHAVSFLNIHLIRYRLNPENQTLTAAYTTVDYLNSEDREQVKPFLKETPVVYEWKSGRFKKEF
jgi:hypothetical protein